MVNLLLSQSSVGLQCCVCDFFFPLPAPLLADSNTGVSSAALPHMCLLLMGPLCCLQLKHRICNLNSSGIAPHILVVLSSD